MAAALATGGIHAARADAIANGYTIIWLADSTLERADLISHVATLLEVTLSSSAHIVSRRARTVAHQVGAAAQARQDAERGRAEEQLGVRRNGCVVKGTRRRRRTVREVRRPVTRSAATNSRFVCPRPPEPPRPLSAAAENMALNSLRIFSLPGGRGRVECDLDAATIAKLRTVLSPLTAPVPQPDGPHDPRTPARRNADGFVEILDRHLGSAALSGSRVPVQVTLTVRLSELLRPGGHESNPAAGGALDGEWPFDLEWTGRISGALAQLLTCDAALRPVIVDDAGVPLAMGREVRLATAVSGQR